MSEVKTPTEEAVTHAAPATQEKSGFREHWPVWMQQLPRLQFSTEPNPNFQLIDRKKLRALLEEKKADPEAIEKIQADLDFLDHELLRLFRERDHQAKYDQNRYRLYQILFMLLAAIATIIGSIQALLMNGQADLVPFFSLIETMIALGTTYLATISGREAPLPSWLNNRRRAESLRREYFRYLVNLPPYDVVEGYERRQLLSTRTANINRGAYPDSNE
ncbi:MAG: DUF4231 domain-containing protein [Anaerolineae bacterium]|nr:DUF4231 domain-containing protein [Anaerolineae bacterium]